MDVLYVSLSFIEIPCKALNGLLSALIMDIGIAEILSHNLIADPYDLPDRCVPVFVRTKEGRAGIMYRTGSRWYNANAPYGESYPLNYIEEWAPVM